MNKSKIVFTFRDEHTVEFDIGACFKGLRHRGERPVRACICIDKNYNFSIINRLANEILSQLMKRSLYSDISIVGTNEKDSN